LRDVVPTTTGAQCTAAGARKLTPPTMRKTTNGYSLLALVVVDDT